MIQCNGHPLDESWPFVLYPRYNWDRLSPIESMDEEIERLELSFERFIIDEDDVCPAEEFTISEVSEEERNDVARKCSYVKDLLEGTGLEILKKA